MNFLSCEKPFNQLSKEELSEFKNFIATYKLKYRKSLEISPNITFGCEFEFAEASLDEISKKINNNKKIEGWQVAADYTVTRCEYGGELISPILTDTEKTWKDIKCLLKMLRECDAETSEKAAFHIHVGSQILGDDENNMTEFLKLWSIFETIIYRFCYGKSTRPRENMKYYARPIASKFLEAYFEKGWSYRVEEESFLIRIENGIHLRDYVPLSGKYQKNNTIEIRNPNSTLSHEIAQNIINLIIKLMLYITSSDYNKETIEYLLRNTEPRSIKDYYDNLELEKALLLSDLIFKDPLDKIQFLKQYIKDESFQKTKRLS